MCCHCLVVSALEKFRYKFKRKGVTGGTEMDGLGT